MKRKLEYRIGDRVFETQAHNILDEEEINNPLKYPNLIRKKIANYMNMPLSDFDEHKVALRGHLIVVSNKI